MRITIKVTGDLPGFLQGDLAGGRKAVTAAVRQAGTGLKRSWRGQITSAGLGTKLANTIRDKYYPAGRPSLGAAAWLYSNADKVVGAFERGVTIRSANGFYLAIPTPAAGKFGAGRARITPGGWEQRTGLRLRFVYRRGKPSLLVSDDARAAKAAPKRPLSPRMKLQPEPGRQSVVMFILVPQVKLRKRLNLARLAASYHAQLPGLIVANWPDQTTKVAGSGT